MVDVSVPILHVRTRGTLEHARVVGRGGEGEGERRGEEGRYRYNYLLFPLFREF